VTSLHTKINIRVFAAYDRVAVRFGNTDVLIPYAIASKMAQAIRLAGKRLKRVGKEQAAWIEIADDCNLEVDDYFRFDPAPHVLQRFNWAVEVEGENVSLVFNEHAITTHYSSMLQISQWIRKAVKKVKAEVGDNSRNWSAMGNLTDAEENYKLGV
jgi:hypothetical protein